MPVAYHSEINDILLTVLSKVLCSWQGISSFVIGLEGHGREESIGQGVDLSRTVGWFTSLYPVELSWEEGLGWGALLKSTKEMLRQIPDKGLGYGYFAISQGLRSWGKVRVAPLGASV